MAAINSLKDLKDIKYITAHVNGGLEMLKAIKSSSKKINKNIKVLGVTVLTSLSEESLKKIGYKKSVKNLVIHQAKIAKEAKLDGIVCSAQEVGIIKNICKNMEIITPGIRLIDDTKDDQKRVSTPKEALNNGATSLVIGRSITKNSIKNNLQKLIDSLK